MVLETVSQNACFSKSQLPPPMSLSATMTRAQSATPSMDAAGIGAAMEKNLASLTTKSLLASADDDAEEWLLGLEAECDIECDHDHASTLLPSRES
jgi:hypothetical protein